MCREGRIWKLTAKRKKPRDGAHDAPASACGRLCDERDPGGAFRPSKMRQQTGHASEAMLSRWVREGELFLGNTAGILF
jgi:hypothetical protein